jgi:hypothetical protein
MPTQNSEKRTAVMRDRATVPATKEPKRRRGVRDRANWIARNAYTIRFPVSIPVLGRMIGATEGQKTDREDRLFICKCADICVELLAGIRLHDGVEEGLHAGDDAGRDIKDGHLIMWWKIRRY